MIADKDEIKELLQIESTDTSYDSLITTLRPIVQNDLFNYLKNDFNTQYTRKTTGETLGVGSTGDDTFEFDEDVFKIDDIYVDGSTKDWAAGSTEDYTLDRNEYKITITSTELNSTSQTVTVDYYYPEYPYSLKLVYADMIDWRLQERKNRNTGYKSESISRYSYTKEDMENGYPKSILKQADKWKKVGFVWP